jgi:hypothetical protein
MSRSSASLATLHLLLRYFWCRGGAGSRLGLLLLLSLLLLFGLLDSGLSNLQSGGSSLVLLSEETVHVGTSDRTCVFDGLSRLLLGDLLSNTLLVLPTVQLGPGDLAWVLALEEEGSAFGGGEAEDFAVSTNEQLTPAWVDTITRE